MSQLNGTIGRTIVDKDNFSIFHLLINHRLQTPKDRRFGVVCRDADGDEGGHK